MPEFFINTKTNCVHRRMLCSDGKRWDRELGEEKVRVYLVGLGNHASLADAFKAAQADYQSAWLCETCEKKEAGS